MPVFIVEIAVKRIRGRGLQTPLKPWQQEKRHQQKVNAEKEHGISDIPTLQPGNAPLKPAPHTRDSHTNNPQRQPQKRLSDRSN